MQPLEETSIPKMLSIFSLCQELFHLLLQIIIHLKAAREKNLEKQTSSRFPNFVLEREKSEWVQYVKTPLEIWRDAERERKHRNFTTSQFSGRTIMHTKWQNHSWQVPKYGSEWKTV